MHHLFSTFLRKLLVVAVAMAMFGGLLLAEGDSGAPAVNVEQSAHRTSDDGDGSTRLARGSYDDDDDDDECAGELSRRARIIARFNARIAATDNRRRIARLIAKRDARLAALGDDGEFRDGSDDGDDDDDDDDDDCSEPSD